MEALYHYIWMHRLMGTAFTSDSGEKVEILHPGIHNLGAGPDFSNARIRIGEEAWVGNVEIHVKASDWHRHGHDGDGAYDNVILHVVVVDDDRIQRTDGTPIPQICINPPADFYNRYAMLVQEMDTPPCIPYLHQVPELNRLDWLSSLGIERLQEKASYIREILESSNGDWQHTLFIILARALGFGLNGVPFELVAKSLPLNFVMRHRDNPVQIEALVFGQAGMLDEREYDYDDYYQLLCREYKFLKAKYSLEPIDGYLWKYSRTRPHNFPHRRLAILASMLADGMQLHTLLLEKRGDYEAILRLFNFQASEYWKRHYRFGTAENPLPLPVTLSKSSLDILAINVAAPFYFAYGSIISDTEIAEMGLNLLRDIKPEKNSVIEIWSKVGMVARSAFDSQALLRLRRSYCSQAQCLQCRFGHYLLRQTLK